MKLNNKKSDFFRTVNIDDVRIELTDNLDIQLSLCTGSPPRQTPNGGEAIREVEMEAIMNLSTAKSLAESLQSVVAELEEVERVQKILETPLTPEEIARANSTRERAFAKAKKDAPRPAEEVKADFRAAWKRIAIKAEEMKKNAKKDN